MHSSSHLEILSLWPHWCLEGLVRGEVGREEGEGVELWGSPSLSRHSLLQLEALLKRDWHVSCDAVNYQMLC